MHLSLGQGSIFWCRQKSGISTVEEWEIQSNRPFRACGKGLSGRRLQTPLIANNHQSHKPLSPSDSGLEDPEELQRRVESDFLCYCNHDGLYADFHSLRHWFITGLARAGVTPKMAQTLARHSDIRLTLGVYTHVELPDRCAAIESLPAPPAGPATWLYRLLAGGSPDEQCPSESAAHSDFVAVEEPITILAGRVLRGASASVRA